MNDFQINAIHYFEDNHPKIFKNLITHLSTKYVHPRFDLGFSYVNILEEQKKKICFTEYVFVDKNQEKVIIVMHKDEVQS